MHAAAGRVRRSPAHRMARRKKKETGERVASRRVEQIDTRGLVLWPRAGETGSSAGGEGTGQCPRWSHAGAGAWRVVVGGELRAPCRALGRFQFWRGSQRLAASCSVSLASIGCAGPANGTSRAIPSSGLLAVGSPARWAGCGLRASRPQPTRASPGDLRTSPLIGPPAPAMLACRSFLALPCTCLCSQGRSPEPSCRFQAPERVSPTSTFPNSDCCAASPLYSLHSRPLISPINARRCCAKHPLTRLAAHLLVRSCVDRAFRHRCFASAPQASPPLPHRRRTGTTGSPCPSTSFLTSPPAPSRLRFPRSRPALLTANSLPVSTSSCSAAVIAISHNTVPAGPSPSPERSHSEKLNAISRVKALVRYIPA